MATTQLQIRRILEREGVRGSELPSVVSLSDTTRWRRVKTFARALLRGIRDWCGDSAYERYLRAVQKNNSSNCAPLTEKQFYVEQLNRRYSRPSRCC
jgi:uncharacterized short protein YbdD (DUF466 family)